MHWNNIKYRDIDGKWYGWFWNLQSLCNACGIRFKKEERRTTAASGNTVVGAAPVQTDQYGHHNSGYNNYHAATGNNNNNGTPWAHHHSTQRVPCNYPANEIRFMDDYGSGVANNGESDGAHGGVPFLSWRLNVADRASLVHDFTRWKEKKKTTLDS